MVERLDELSDAFAGSAALSRISKDEQRHLKREMLRAQAESLLPQLAAANVGSLPLARSVIELMQERMQMLQGAAADAGRAVSRDQAEAGRAEAAVMRAELQAKGREVELYREELRGARPRLEPP